MSALLEQLKISSTALLDEERAELARHLSESLNSADRLPSCSLLLIVAVWSEEKALKEVATELGYRFEKKSHSILGEYFVIGKVGDFEVIAVRTEMGSFGFAGSAAKAIYFKTATTATTIIQLGMAFGIDPTNQKFGDVLVSSSIIPYDRRDVVATDHGYQFDYAPAFPASPARSSMVELFTREQQQNELEFRVQVGAFISGSTQISSRLFRDEMVRTLQPLTDNPIIGGEMEGIGLLSVSNPDDPAWVLVKGISDFADETRHSHIKETRPIACRNAARFVLTALAKASEI